MDSLHEHLRTYFGYDTFHPLQEGIIRDILSGKDVFVLMPTGSGKSLCYQLPAILQDGLTVVISPLIALMKDQVDSLRRNGIPASCINSSLTPSEIQAVKDRIQSGTERLLYIAPERLASPDFLGFLADANVKLFAIDEAHCISEWGHDFRPEYRKLSILRRQFPGVPIIALTATAVPEVRSDIIRQLNLFQVATYQGSFNRENLRYAVRPKKDAYKSIVKYLRGKKKDSSIIYCHSRMTAERLASKLRSDGFRALPYHAGLSAFDRENNQDLFLRDDADIIVATVAFGMGINKTNVRSVIHYDLPKNIESYYQETGRAGRDRLPSECILFFSYGDRHKIDLMIKRKTHRAARSVADAKLKAMLDFCESSSCRRVALLGYFGEQFDGPCNACDICTEPRLQTDETASAQAALRCVMETGQRFGMTHVIDVLTGKKTPKVQANNNMTCASFGAGVSHPAAWWQRLLRQLIRDNALEVAGDKYPILKLNQKSRDVLWGKITVLMESTASDTPIESIAAQEPAHTTMPTHSIDDLFEALRSLRKELADAERVPPYVIFPDRTLREMAAQCPHSLIELKRIYGVGETKLEKYGPRFLERLATSISPHDTNTSIDIPNHAVVQTT